MGSIAGKALWWAIRTFDESKNVPLKRWIARCVKQGVWSYWRQIRVRPDRLATDTGLEDVPENREHPEDLPISREDFKLLIEYYVEKWPLDVVARRYGVGLHTARKMLKAAVSRLRETRETNSK